MSLFHSMARRLDLLPPGRAALLGGVVGVVAVLAMRQLDWPGGVVVVGPVLILAILLGFSAEPLAVELEVEEEDPNRPPKNPKPGQEWTNPVDGSVLVYVPGGEYRLGSENVYQGVEIPRGLEDNAKEWESWARPMHRVHLSGFWIGRDPITNEQYRRFLADNSEADEPKFWDDSRFNEERQPVVGVSWDEAKAYCGWAGLALPTESQWEAAARGQDERRYPWGNEEPGSELACFGQDFTTGQPAEVGSFPRGNGPFGTRDQAGNVWEWCEDPWDESAYAHRDGESDPLAEGDPTIRVVRGGSWRDWASYLRSANRNRNGVQYRDVSLGFRCVGSVPSEP